jgi:hypothetical protein
MSALWNQEIKSEIKTAEIHQLAQRQAVPLADFASDFAYCMHYMVAHIVLSGGSLSWDKIKFVARSESKYWAPIHVP